MVHPEFSSATSHTADTGFLTTTAATALQFHNDGSMTITEPDGSTRTLPSDLVALIDRVAELEAKHERLADQVATLTARPALPADLPADVVPSQETVVRL